MSSAHILTDGCTAGARELFDRLHLPVSLSTARVRRRDRVAQLAPAVARRPPGTRRVPRNASRYFAM